MTSVDNGKGAYGPDVRGEKRYLVWVCEGCDSCDPPDGSERSPFPCTHESPSVNGMWVVQAAQAEAHERDLRHEAYDRLVANGWKPSEALARVDYLQRHERRGHPGGWA